MPTLFLQFTVSERYYNILKVPHGEAVLMDVTET